MGIRCFLLVDARKTKRFLRRYVSASKCAAHGYHDAMNFIDILDGSSPSYEADEIADISGFAGDSRWPIRCDCGYEFQDGDVRQVFTRRLWRREDSGEEFTLDEAPEGAIWEASWYSGIPSWCGPDGKALICKCPGGHDWHIDGRASNCTMPNDNVHRCWVRHGTPPNLTVDKNGNTCQAGAGSIQTPNWHGFLRNGELVQA